MNKRELLDAIRTDRARFDELLACLTEARLTEPSFDGGWSAKDVLAHVTAWEQRCLDWIRNGGEKPAPLFTPEGLDAYNAGVCAETRDDSLADVVGASRNSHLEIFGVAESLTESELSAPPTWAIPIRLDVIVHANTSEHYRVHIEQIERWLSRGS